MINHVKESKWDNQIFFLGLTFEKSERLEMNQALNFKNSLKTN